MTYKKKLIEVAIPLAKINEESAKQKTMGAAPHPQNLHRWWARRPLAAARAVLFAQLVDDPSALSEQFPTEEALEVERKRLFDIIERLVVWENTNDQALLAEAHAEILKSCDGDLPNVLDPFGGGGAITLESLRLGLPTFTGDLNPVAVLIQRAMFEVPQRFGGNGPVHPDARISRALWAGAEGLAADVDAYGRWMQQEAKSRIGKYYPDVVLEDGSKATPIAWIWARTVKSPDPSWPGHVPLVRSWVLSKKPGKPTVWVEPIIDRESKTIRYEVRTGGTPGEASVERGKGTCIATGVLMTGDYIKAEGCAGRIGQRLLAVVGESPGGRVYCSPDLDQENSARVDVPDDIPLGKIGIDPRNIWVTLYGLDEWWKLFTPRQLVALTTFSDLIENARERIESDAVASGLDLDGVRLRDGGTGATAYADGVITYLAFVIDRSADYWSSICSWHASNSQVRETFARQAIPMTWDYAEANPFSGRMGSWESMLKTTVRAIPTLHTPIAGETAQRDARARIAEVGTCLISTDPPYYDNISYADLSDFFFVWLRRNLADVWPDEASTLLTPKAEELIANQYRAGSKKAANEYFESGMQEVFAEAARKADPRFPAAIFYAFKAAEDSSDGLVSTGWETFLNGLLHAGYAITATWPVRTELANKIGSKANMLASSIVLACRPREVTAAMATRGEFIGALRAEMIPAVRLLQKENIAPVDMAQSAMGPGIAIFSRYPKVVEADGSSMSVRTALSLINEVLAEALSGEESEFDADTRFALTWFEQFGHNPGPAGDAITLATAKNTSVAGVETSGIASSRDGKFRLLERDELDESWDPASDSRLTVWESTQYLIRALDDSETSAADLLRRIGQGFGERARQLAYLLYGICDRNKWAQEAGAYNMLVTAWPEIERLAGDSHVEGPVDDDRLF